MGTLKIEQNKQKKSSSTQNEGSRKNKQSIKKKFRKYRKEIYRKCGIASETICSRYKHRWGGRIPGCLYLSDLLQNHRMKPSQTKKRQIICNKRHTELQVEETKKKQCIIYNC